jgi:nucleoside-diphosphate-sugar epimerase
MEIVHHLASLIPQRKAKAETMQAVNVGGSQHVLDGAERAGVRRVVYLSSVENYGLPAVVPCPENGPLAPLAEYGRTKVAAETLCRQAVARGLDVTILRPVTILGPGLTEPFLVSLLAAVRTGKPVILLGNGHNRFQFVHAEDVVAACLLAAGHPAAVGQAFNIGAADVPPIRHLVEAVIRQAGSNSSVFSIPVPLARLALAVLRLFDKAPLEPAQLAIATTDYLFDITRAQRVLGWEPQWSNLEAVMDTYRALM